MNRRLHNISVRRTGRQRGVALPIALMVLVFMMLAAITLVRSVDTATMVAGNLTFKQRASHAGDEGVRAGYLWLQDKATTAPADLFNNSSADGYFASQHADDPAWNPATSWPSASAKAMTEDAGGNTVSYVIHRLCSTSGLSYNAPGNQCATHSATSSAAVGGSESTDAPLFSGVVYVYYRITARVIGPRNTTSYIQSLVLVPVS